MAGKDDPQEVISAVSAFFKQPKPSVFRLTLKRGGVWKPEFAQAHSRQAWKEVRQLLKAESTAEDQTWPLLIRFKQADTRLKALVPNEHCNKVVEELLGTIRAAIFKIKNQIVPKLEPEPTKPNPKSKSTEKKQKRKIRNKERTQKRKQIKKKTKKATKNKSNELDPPR